MGDLLDFAEVALTLVVLPAAIGLLLGLSLHFATVP